MKVKFCPFCGTSEFVDVDVDWEARSQYDAGNVRAVREYQCKGACEGASFWAGPQVRPKKLFDVERAERLAGDVDALVRNRTTGPLSNFLREVRDFLLSGEEGVAASSPALSQPLPRGGQQC